MASISADADDYRAIVEIMAEHGLTASSIRLHVGNDLAGVQVETRDEIMAWGTALGVPVQIASDTDRSVQYHTPRVPIGGRRVEVSACILSDVYLTTTRALAPEFDARLTAALADALAAEATS